MKPAIILSGEMRTFATCVHSQRWHVYRHFPNADFYISTFRTAQTDSALELKKLLPDARVEISVIEAQPDLPEPHEPVRFEPYGRSVPVQAVLRQLWQNERAWRFMQGFAREYDLIIRMRPDSYFHSFTWPWIPASTEAITPWWGRFGGINDRFAVMGEAAARDYFTAYSQIEALMKLGCPLHPESLVYAALQTNGHGIDDTMQAEFSTLKLDGQRPPEISMIDLAHAALR